MDEPTSPSSFQERVARVRERLVERLRAFQPGPRAFATAFCVGATIGEYTALAGSTDPTVVLTTVTALGSALGVNLLADIIGERKPPPGLTVEEIAQAVQERLEQGDDLPAVRALLREFDVVRLALETWHQVEDKRWQQLVDELSRHPQLVAEQTTAAVLAGLDPRLATLEERTQRILELLETAPRAPGLPPSDVLKRPVPLADYRIYLRRLYADLPLSGIPVPLDVTLPLDRVYIKLRALPKQEEAAHRKAALHSDSDKELPRRLAERLWRQREEWEEWEEAACRLEKAQSIPPEEAIARHDHLVILGDAGAGKSTLLRHLAWERADAPKRSLTLLIPLGRADTLISQAGCSLLEAAFDLLTEHKAGEERELLKQALADAIRDKKVLFLCDGLDEAHLVRRSVVAGLEKLAADGQRLVVTSRPLGYERLATLEHFQLLPLLPEDAKAFSDRWFRALAEARGVPQAEREGWAAGRANWLKRQLDERPGLREVARNPLLLTFLAVLAGDEPQRDLPPRRKELYREYVERLFTVWEARRQRDGELSLGKLRGEEAHRVVLWGLYRTAWHLHRAYYGSGRRPRAVRREVEPLLARDLKKQWEVGALQAEVLAAELLRFWEGAGLLDVYLLGGQEWLTFRHLTFQEYGTARALGEAYRDDGDGLWGCLSPHLLRPRWAGVIPLTLAYLEGTTFFLERLLEANAEDEGRQRPLLLAAAVLAEGASVAEALRQRVVDELDHLARTRRLWEWGVRANASDAIVALSRMEEEPYAIQRLLALARDGILEWWVREQATEALGQLGQVDGLLLLARDDTVDPEVRVAASNALGELDRGDEAAPVLLTLAREGMLGWRVRERATEVLGQLGRADELLVLARDDTVDARVRLRAGRSLGELDAVKEAALVLLVLARDRMLGWRVREQAIEALCQLDRADKLVVLAHGDAVDPEVLMAAVNALDELDWAEEAAPILLELARDRMLGWRVRKRATEALGQLSRADKLLALARDDAVDPEVRVAAVNALSELTRLDEAVPILLTLARDEQELDLEVCLAAVNSLRESGFVKQAANILEAVAMNRAMDWDSRYSAVQALYDSGDDAMAWQVEEAFRKMESESGGSATGTALWNRLSHANAESFEAILQDVANGQFYFGDCVKVAKSLISEGLIKDASDVLLAVVRADGDPEDLFETARLLAELGREAEASEALLALMLATETQWETRMATAEAMGRLGWTDQLAGAWLRLAENENLDADQRLIAIAALRAIGYTYDADRILLALACDDRLGAWVRVQAIEALGELGQTTATPEVLAGLQVLSEERGTPGSVRGAARWVLCRLQSYRAFDVREVGTLTGAGGGAHPLEAAALAVGARWTRALVS